MKHLLKVTAPLEQQVVVVPVFFTINIYEMKILLISYIYKLNCVSVLSGNIRPASSNSSTPQAVVEAKQRRCKQNGLILERNQGRNEAIERWKWRQKNWKGNFHSRIQSQRGCRPQQQFLQQVGKVIPLQCSWNR